MGTPRLGIIVGIRKFVSTEDTVAKKTTSLGPFYVVYRTDTRRIHVCPVDTKPTWHSGYNLALRGRGA